MRIANRVSVVVLNWNSGGLGTAAVTSVRAQSWSDLEVIVVDNASTDGSLERIMAEHDGVTLVRNVSNFGFAVGMNAGIAVATGEFVLPMNCDAELGPDYVGFLVRALRRHPRAAAAGGLVRSPRVGDAGPLAITATMRTRACPTESPMDCDKVNGACPLFRRTALDQVIDRFGGPYDPTYDTYGEDVDLALTLRRLGWTYRFEPEASAYHVRSYASAPRLADRRGRLRITTLANRHRNIVRHGRWWPVLDAVAAAQDVGFSVLSGVRGDLSAVHDLGVAWSRHLRFLGPDLARRRLLAPRRPATMCASLIVPSD